MKTKMKILVIVAFLFLAMILSACSDKATQNGYAYNEPVSYQVFYDHLSPYGMWVNYPPYGYAWVPDMYGFTPYYTGGSWIYTSYGWTWNSYYSWGWAPFHYGRWILDVRYGWMWIPDTVWGPAWVAWRMGGGYCAWAPLSPSVKVNVTVTTSIPRNHWVFVPSKNLSSRNIHRYRIKPSKNDELISRAPLIRQTLQRNHIQYIPGPDRNEIQKAIGKPVNPVAIHEQKNPGRSYSNNNGYELYKPQVHKEDFVIHKVAPADVYELREFRGRNERPMRPQPADPFMNEVRDRPLQSINPAKQGLLNFSNGNGKGKKDGN